tara:strand:- start:266 stop:523 length:258 start_codon:yes stop_codon:yes gene_type:complete
VENLDSILQGIGAILTILISAFAAFKIHRSGEEVKRAEKMVDALTEQAHDVIKVEAEEDHEEVAEALKKDDKAAAIADLFNDRVD